MFIKNQQGAALILLVVAIILTATTVFVTRFSTDKLKLNKQASTNKALMKAKKALLSHAASYYETQLNRAGRYGYLPCPETASSSAEGIAQLNCGLGNSIGRLPWNNLTIEPLKDSAGQCLWYAVSYSNKNIPNSLMLNEDTPGMFEVYDENGTLIHNGLPENRIVAVIIAPGAELSGQSRPAPNGSLCNYNFQQANNNADAFLDSINGIDNSNVSTSADQIDHFATLNSVKDLSNFNDRIVTITQQEIFNAIRRQVNRNNTNQTLQEARIRILTEALAWCLIANADDSSGARALPWPAPIALTNDYRVDESYDDTGVRSIFGRYPFDIRSFDGSVTNIFDNCNGINLTINNNLLPNEIGDPSPIDLSDTAAANIREYRNLWENWKDHFFYAVSNDFDGSTGNGNCSTAANCYRNSNSVPDRYAGIVIFSGAALNNFNQLRRAVPPEVSGSVLVQDSKDDVTNYLEASLPVTGSGVFILNGTGNDIAYCLNDDATGVEACP